MDLHLLNHDGNIIDAASIAAIVALCHFRRPDVSVQGDEVTLVSRRAPPRSVGERTGHSGLLSVGIRCALKSVRKADAT